MIKRDRDLISVQFKFTKIVKRERDLLSDCYNYYCSLKANNNN